MFKEVSERVGYPSVGFSYINDDKKVEEIWSDDLTSLLDHLRKIVGVDKVFDPKEEIIGIDISQKLTK